MNSRYRTASGSDRPERFGYEQGYRTASGSDRPERSRSVTEPRAVATGSNDREALPNRER